MLSTVDELPFFLQAEALKPFISEDLAMSTNPIFYRTKLGSKMGSRRFTRLTNGFSKNLDNHVAAVALYVAHYNLCRVHEALRTTPAKAIGVADRAWSIGQLVDAALAVAPALPTETPPDRRRRFTVIQGGKNH